MPDPGSIRPDTLDAFIGQQAVLDPLTVYLEAARERAEALDHVLLYGPPGLGKTTLAHVIAHELGAELVGTSGPVVDVPGDLVGLLTTLGEGDVLFVDEIHRLKPEAEEFLYTAMEDFRVEIRAGEGVEAETVTLALPPFTLVGATTRFGLLTAPLRSRFGIVERLDLYPVDELTRIVARSAELLGVTVVEGGARAVARAARGTPRRANRLLRRVRDWVEVRGDGTIDAASARSALAALEVDPDGLGPSDHRLLRAIADTFEGGPVGLKTLAAALGEDAGTLEEVVEPYLIREGLLQRTARGRVLTARGRERVRGGAGQGAG